MSKITNNQGIDALLSDLSIEEVIDGPSLGKRLQSGKKLRVKFGVDPTSPDLHLGHAVALRILRQFQDLGHETILLIGDFTTKIGDPSGRIITRPVLTDQEIKANLKTYVDQAKLIIDPKKTKIWFNSEWLAKKSYSDIITLAMNLGVSNLLEREDFQNRLRNNQPIAFHELFYPFTQALDSVEMKADVELGGWDQRLNLLMGRELQKKLGQQPQEVVITKELIGTDGVRKMSKSLGNYVGISEPADQMFGKLMSVPDKLIESYAVLAAHCSADELAKIKAMHPREAKAEMALKTVALYHGESAAGEALRRFNATFRDKKIAEQLAAELMFTEESVSVLEAVRQAAEVSRSQAERLITQGAVRIDGQPVRSIETKIDLDETGILMQVGKHTFRRIKRRR